MELGRGRAEKDIVGMGWPDKPVAIKSLGKAAAMLDRAISAIDLLGGGKPVQWEQTPGALVIQPPGARADALQPATVYRIRLQ